MARPTLRVKLIWELESRFDRMERYSYRSSGFLSASSAPYGARNMDSQSAYSPLPPLRREPSVKAYKLRK
jgi:hypothetical protein